MTTEDMPKGGDLVVALMQDGPNFKQGYSFANALFGAAQYEALHAETAASESITIYGAILARDAVLALISKHIPSITDAIEEELDERTVKAGMVVPGYESEVDTADLALRICHCGERIDGFYEYVEHLKQVFSER